MNTSQYFGGILWDSARIHSTAINRIVKFSNTYYLNVHSPFHCHYSLPWFFLGLLSFHNRSIFHYGIHIHVHSLMLLFLSLWRCLPKIGQRRNNGNTESRALFCGEDFEGLDCWCLLSLARGLWLIDLIFI